MSDPSNILLKGERTMSRGFIAQYAAEAAKQTDGVFDMDKSGTASFKETFGVEHEGYGVIVKFREDDKTLVEITVYAVLYFGNILPEVAWHIQENVKRDVEKYTGLVVEAVNVHVKRVIERGNNEKII